MTVECARVGGINLAQGVCDTPVPEEVRSAAREAIEAGANLYSRCEGREELRGALAEKMRRDSGLDYDPDHEIVVTNGATGAFYVAALALLNSGDEVILFEPYYGYHASTLISMDVIPKFATLAPPDWRLRLDELEALVGPRTRGLVLNTPGNPSGKVFSRPELEMLADFACRHDLFAFTDEVYEHFVFDDREHLSPAQFEGMRERTITISALSKTFAVTGWRLGWMAADRRWSGAFAALNDLVYVCAPTPLQLGAARALELLPPAYYSGISTEYQRKRDRLCGVLERVGLAPFLPQGSYFVLADISRIPGSSSEKRVLRLLEETGVAAVPGSAFFSGAAGDHLARFSFGKTDADLEAACSRLERLRA